MRAILVFMEKSCTDLKSNREAFLFGWFLFSKFIPHSLQVC